MKNKTQKQIKYKTQHKKLQKTKQVCVIPKDMAYQHAKVKASYWH